MDYHGHIRVDLSDGRTLQFSLEQLLAINPIGVKLFEDDPPQGLGRSN